MWFVVVVLLVEGRGEVLDPPSGRAYLVGPTHTFADLSRAIDMGFARWDRQRPHRFDLPGDRHIGPADGALDLGDEELLSVASELSVTDRFTYVFDGEWFHRCHVEEAVPDPADVYGERPAEPLAVDGWGMIPDQHGRRVRDPSPGTSPGPSPGPVDLDGAWSRSGREDLRRAVGHGDLVTLVALLRDRSHVHDVLQLVGDALLSAIVEQVRGAPEIVARCVASLRERSWEGDAELASVLEGVFGAPVATLHPVPVTLPELARVLDAATGSPVVLDTATGDIHGGDPGAADSSDRVPDDGRTPAASGERAPPDDPERAPEHDAGRWLELSADDRRATTRDMVSFADQLADPVVAERLYAALDGTGGLRRFRLLVREDADVLDAWKAFSEERRLGRVRARLAAHGYRPE